MSDFKTLYEDMKKKAGISTDSSSTKSGGSGSNFMSLYNQMKNASRSGYVSPTTKYKPIDLSSGSFVSEVDYDPSTDYGRWQAANDWANRYTATMRGVADYQQKNSSNVSADYGRYLAAIDDLLADYENIRGYADQSGMRNSSTYYDTLQELKKNITERNDFMSQFDSADAYTQYVANQEEQQRAYDELLNYDVAAGEKAVGELEKELAKWDEVNQYYQQYVQNGGDPNNLPASLPWVSDYNRLVSKYGSYDALTNDVAKRRATGKKAARTQELYNMSGVAYEGADTYDPNFQDKIGYQTTKEDSWWGKSTSEGGLGYGDLTYEYINNADGNTRDYILENYNGSRERFAKLDRMSQDQVDIYNYYYSTAGKEAADRYLSLIEEGLNAEIARDMVAARQGQTGREISFASAAALDRFGSNISVLANGKGKDYITPSATQLAVNGIYADLADNGPMLPEWLGGKSLAQAAYDIVDTSTYMAPSMLASAAVGVVSKTAGAAVGSALMGAASGGNAYTEMLNAGYSQEQAKSYGILIGASEATLEKLLGGISAFGGGTLSNAVLSKLDDIDNGFARFARGAGGKVVANGASELLEEGLQSVLEPMIYEAITGEEKNVDWSEVAYSSLMGFITGGMFEGGTQAYNSALKLNADITAGKAVQNPGELNAFADELAPTISYADRRTLAEAQKKAESGKTRHVGNLYNTVEELVTEKDSADIVKSLTRKGISEESATTMAEIITGYMTDKLTDAGKAQFNEILKDKRVQTVVTDLIDNKLSTVGARNQKLAATKNAEARTVDMDKVKAQHAKEFIEQNLEYKVSDDGRTFDTKTGKAVEVVGIKDIGKNGAVMVNLEGGKVADAADLSFASEEVAMAYSALKGRQMSAANANALIQLSEGMDIQEFAKQVEHGYERGYANLAKPEGKVAEAAYNAGADQRTAETKAAKKTTESGGIKVLRKDGSTADFASLKETMNLSKKQVAAVATIEFLQKMDLGTTFTLVESYTKLVKGKKRSYFVDENGVEQAAPNGRYYKNGHIYIDLSAGSNRSGDVMLYTVAHELTHHIQEWNAAKYKVLADFLAEEYGKQGLDAYTQIKAKQQELSENRGKSVSFNEAYHEFVADALSSMFIDGNVYSKLAKLHAKDADLFTELKNYIDKFLYNVKSLFYGTLGETREAKFTQLKLSTESIEFLQQQMAEALVEAGSNYKAYASGDYTGTTLTNEAAFEDSQVAVQNQIRPPYTDGSKAFNAFAESLSPEARKTFDLFYGFYQKSRVTYALSVTGKRVKSVNISSLYLLAQDWNDMLQKEPKWASAAQELADFLPDDVRKRMNMNKDGSLNPTLLEKEFKMPSSMAQRLVDALPVENIDGTYMLGDKMITLPEGKARQSVGGEAYRRAIIEETRKLFAEGKLKPANIITMSKDRWGSLGFLAANGKTGASGDFTTVCPQMMFNRGCWYCYRRAAMEKGVNNKLVAQSVWYTGEILRIKQSVIDDLNKNGGLRIQSFGDWMPHFSAMLADVLYDAEQRGLQVKIITKEPSMINYIAALRDQGIGKNLYFNLSADYTIEKGPAKQNLANGSLDTINPERPFMRNDSGIWWKRAMTVEEAAKYREKYPWVNTRIVATTLGEFIRGLKDPRVDVVTGYHGNIRTMERIDSETGQYYSGEVTTPVGKANVNVEALGDAGMPRFAFNPSTGQWVTEYEGKTSTHKRLAEAIAQNGLQMEYYTKTCCITGRCATCAGKCGKLARDFNIKNATNRDAESVAYWRREMQYGIEPEFGDMTIDADTAQFSDRVTDKKLLSFLNKQLRDGEVTEVYRAMAVGEDGNLYPPMAGYVTRNGKKVINGDPSKIGAWEQSAESIPWETVSEEFLLSEGFKYYPPTKKDYPNGRYVKDNNIFYKNKKGEWKSKFHLEKDNGDSVDAAYAPYIHTSLSMLNDQFTSAYKRSNLVVVRGYVPNSEVNGVDGKRYQANFAEKPVGRTKWHSGVVAAQMPETRVVILSRYFMPVEIVSDSVMAQKTKEMMRGKDIEIPFNVVTPSQRRAMEAIGIRIGEARGLKDPPKLADIDAQAQFSDRYWYPQMTKNEISEVKDLAKSEAGTTKNYLGIDVKWLYNTQKGHRYFALYSTARKDSPVMYACKGDRADYEYQILTNVINEGGYLYESTNGSARPSARILNRIGSFADQKTQHHNRPLGTGGNNGNAPTHSQNRRMRPSAAFKNCIKNIEQAQQRYSLDDHYQFAVDIGNYNAAQAMVNDAARNAMGDKLAPGVENTIYIKDGHTKDGKVVDFANAILDGKKKGETRTHKNLTRKWVGIAKDGMVIGRVKLGDPIVLRKGTEEYRNSLIEGTEYDIEDGQTKYYYPVEKIMDLRNNPRPIIRNGNYGQYQFKSNAPDTYDADGNLIPLSERFNLESDDFYHSDRIYEDAKSATDFVAFMRNKVKTTGGWYGKDVFSYVDEHPELNFVERIFEKDKTVKKDLAAVLDAMDDVKVLEGLSWYMGEAYGDKGHTWSWDEGSKYPYRGAVRTFRNAVKKRINAITSEKVGGTNLGIKNGEVTLSSIKELYGKLNTNTEMTQFAEKVFATADRLGVNIRFVNQTLSKQQVAGDNLGDMVEYKTSYFNDTAVADQSKANTLLHELIHACTVYVMSANVNAGDTYWNNKSEEYNRIANAATRLNRIYNEIRYDPAFRNQYGITSAKEMVAELADDEFVGLLKKKNLWDHIVDWICELFGIRRSTSAYDNAMLCLDYILDHPDVSEYKAHAREQRSAARYEGYEVFGQTLYSDRIDSEAAMSDDITEDLRRRGEEAIRTATAQRESKVTAEQKTHRAVRAALTNRDLIAQIEGKTKLEKRKLEEYNAALKDSRKYAAAVSDLNKQIKNAEESDAPNKEELIKALTIDLNKAKANKKTMDSKLTRMENKELEPLVARERVRILDALREEYGTIPTGENAVRDDSLPTSTDSENFVSRTARTVKGAAATPDDFADLIDTEVAKGGLTYIRITNDEATQRAVEKITKDGWEQARAEWSAAIKAGKASAEMSAMGALLLNNAANAGDKKAWLDILHDYQQMGTNAAQAVQALRILKSLAPSDKLYMAQKSLDQLVDQLKTKGKLKINEELKRRYLNAKTDAERDSIMEEIQQDLANQIPATLKERWTALRYLNMLGNLRTQSRNLVGNASMGLAVSVKDLIATGIESLAYIASDGQFERTKALLPGKELRKAAAKDYDFVADIIATGGKFNDANNASSAFVRGVMEKRTIFRGKILAGLEAYRKGTNLAMDKGDVMFSKAAYAKALAGYLKAHGVTETDFSKINETLLEKARLYAVQEAQEATFHDINAVSEFVTRRYRGENKAGRALSLALDGIMPFRKTPANILVRAWEYSPLGITNALMMSAKAVSKNSDVTGAEIVNTWSKALTGSTLFVAGLLMASAGSLIGGPDDDDSEDKFQQLTGEQNYALKLGKKYITIDWASPAAIPLFMGAQLYQLVQEDGFQLKDIEAALTSIADPLVEMSMLQGVNDTLDNIKYSDNKLMQLAINTMVGYFTQGLTNTALGQIERSFEDSRSTTYVDKNNDLPDWLQRAIGKASAKFPGLDYGQIPYINAWGEEEENPGILRSLAYNMLSPSYITEDKSDAVSTELQRLEGVNTTSRSVYPSSAGKKFTFTDKDGVVHKDYYLSADEYVALAKNKGQTQRELVENMIASQLYKDLPDLYKAKAIQAVYTYANENSQIEVLNRDGFSSKWMSEIKGDVATGILEHIYEENAKDMYLAGEITVGDTVKVLQNYSGLEEAEASEKVAYWDFQEDYPEYKDLSQSAVTDYYDFAKPSGIPVSVYYDYCTKAKGKSKKADKMSVINSMPISARQKDALYYSNGWAESTIDEAPWH